MAQEAVIRASTERGQMKISNWPELHYEAWSDTCRTIHLWTQIIGKIRLSKMPWANHSWNSTLYVTERGLTTSVIHDLDCSFSIELDFFDHALKIRRSDGKLLHLPLRAGPVASFYESCLQSLRDLGIQAEIFPRPNELQDSTPFFEDNQNRPYDSAYASRFWRALMSCDKVLKNFNSRFVGKVSPVHFFWGSFDLAVSRFSGRKAPEHPGGFPNLPDLITRDAYSHELFNCGFWPGNEQHPEAAFYSYAYPAPEGFDRMPTVTKAFYEPKLREFILPYEAVRLAENPEELLMEFFQSTYEAAADLAHWDRQLLEESKYLSLLQKKSTANINWPAASKDSGKDAPNFMG